MPDTPGSENPVFFDTNILLYLFDRNADEKRRIAKKLFKTHQRDGSLRLSLQVVHEFAVNLLSKKFAVPRAAVTEIVQDLFILGVTETRGEDTLSALAFAGELQISFWDALILATAKREGCKTLYSEDFQHGRLYSTVRVINPFKAVRSSI